MSKSSRHLGLEFYQLCIQALKMLYDSSHESNLGEMMRLRSNFGRERQDGTNFRLTFVLGEEEATSAAAAFSAAIQVTVLYRDQQWDS